MHASVIAYTCYAAGRSYTTSNGAMYAAKSQEHRAMRRRLQNALPKSCCSAGNWLSASAEGLISLPALSAYAGAAARGVLMAEVPKSLMELCIAWGCLRAVMRSQRPGGMRIFTCSTTHHIRDVHCVCMVFATVLMHSNCQAGRFQRVQARPCLQVAINSTGRCLDGSSHGANSKSVLAGQGAVQELQ